ncbi:MAG: rhodanese-like domain-containing protein [Hyphomicrobiales bacterium]|nr:rhodanese-like domain-containing protein [Hyphomicrobiales bacterium]
MARYVRGVCVMCFLVLLAALPAQGGADITTISVDDLDLYRDAGMTVIDVRRTDEWRSTGVIEGSTLITAFDGDGRLNPNFVAEVARIADPAKPLALICRSGRRSAVAAQLLTEQAGLTEVWSVDGGMNAWLGSHKPVAPCTSC